MSVGIRDVKIEEGLVGIGAGRKLPPIEAKMNHGEAPIVASWSLYGKPSDLVLVQKFAERLGVAVQWWPSSKGLVVRGKRLEEEPSE